MDFENEFGSDSNFIGFKAITYAHLCFTIEIDRKNDKQMQYTSFDFFLRSFTNSVYCYIAATVKKKKKCT